MFTGIVECMGKIVKIENDRTNINIEIKSPISNLLKVDQSVSHNGICLTVTKVEGDIHRITAIDETISKTNLKFWKKGDEVNLERSLLFNSRIDGHLVQGHVDTTGKCEKVTDKNGSKKFVINYFQNELFRTIEKGSIAVNGISLTVVESKINQFAVEIIPYTLNNTNLKAIEPGSILNLEFDIIGKWVKEWMK
ncbi:MAG: riboflavin synthase [Bacteroidetes bacterium]|nr:riboflavin synthase [Bacteroidota bacterium]